MSKLRYRAAFFPGSVAALMTACYTLKGIGIYSPTLFTFSSTMTPVPAVKEVFKMSDILLIFSIALLGYILGSC
jgi:predicted small secreted protein